MGTNYYAYRIMTCPHCHTDIPIPGDESWHIGKVSVGWCFSLHVIPEEDLHTLDDWAQFLSDKLIKDEYGEELTFDQMIKLITERKRAELPTDFDPRTAEIGPNNLLRGKIRAVHYLRGIPYESNVIGHGDGPWTLQKGDFY
jgi:hypothetical protein